MNLKISIITVCYNSEKTIRNTIESVLSQTYKNIEYLIIDGASTDSTLSIINEYKNKIHTICSEKDNGIYYAMNKGLELCTGDIIGFLNSDDVFANKNILEIIFNKFQNSNAKITYGDLLYVNQNLTKIIRSWKSKKFNEKLIQQGWLPPHPTFYFQRKLIEKLGPFDVNFKIGADIDFMIRYLLNVESNAIEYIPHILVLMRIGGKSNNSLSGNFIANFDSYKALKKYNIKFPSKIIFQKIISKIPQFFHKENNTQWKPFQPILKITGNFVDFFTLPLKILPKKQTNLFDFKKILIVDAFLIGDNIMTTALVNSLKSQYPNSQIDILGNNSIKSIFSPTTVNNLITAKIPWSTYDYSLKNLFYFFKKIILLKFEHYDLAIETRGDWRNCLLMFLTRAKIRLSTCATGGKNFINLATPKVNKYTNLNEIRLTLLKKLTPVPKNYSLQLEIEDLSFKKIENYLKSKHLISNNFFVFHPGASRAYKVLPKEVQIKVLHMISNFLPCVIALGPNDLYSVTEDDINQSSFKNKVVFFQENLNTLFALMKLSRCNFTMDSAAAHISAAVGNYTIVFTLQENAWNMVKPLTNKGFNVEYNKLSYLTGEFEFKINELITLILNS